MPIFMDQKLAYNPPVIIELAEAYSLLSPDDSTKYGAVIVTRDSHIIVDCNCFPRHVFDSKESFPERWSRPEKYFFIEHAERNAIFQASLNGIPLKGSIIYIRRFPCSNCARAIIQSGISKVFYWEDHTDVKWIEEQKYAELMFEEAQVTASKLVRGKR